MNRNNKALSTLGWALAIIVIIGVVVGIVVALSGTAPAESTTATVYLDNIVQAVNYSQPQPLTWEGAQQGWSYTQNLTVQSLSTQNLTMQLYTTEPAGTHLSWAGNNTQLAPNSVATAPLILGSYMPGTYTWQLTLSNSTFLNMPPPTEDTPIYITFQIDAANGVENITVTTATEQKLLTTDTLPKNMTCQTGTNVKLEINIAEGYLFNGWDFADGKPGSKLSTFIITDVQSTFAVKADIIPTT